MVKQQETDLTDEFDKPIRPESGISFIPPEEDPLVTPSLPPQNQKIRKEIDSEYGQARFLNASTNNLPLNILIDNHIFASALEFGTISAYGKVADGFRMVTISSAMNPRMIFYRKSVPFIKGEPVTMVITDDVDGLDLVQVSDKGCDSIDDNMGCFRTANMSFEDSSYDLMFYSGDTVFANVRFKETTFFKEAEKGKYEFFIARAVTGSERTELMTIHHKSNAEGIGIAQPLYWFTVDIEPHRKYTAYIIGNVWSMDALRVLVVEN